MNYSIGQFSKLIDLSAPTLRYYEKEKLLIVHRDKSGRRFYTTDDIAWIFFIKNLKDTGMSIKDITKYALLRYQGDSTIAQRLEILEKQKLNVIVEKEKWEINLCNLEEKIAIYKSAL